MGVKYIQYKIAKCDMCGNTKQFSPTWSLPDDWNKIEDTLGVIRYECVCCECSKRIKGYIEEFKLLHYKEEEGSEDD